MKIKDNVNARCCWMHVHCWCSADSHLPNVLIRELLMKCTAAVVAAFWCPKILLLLQWLSVLTKTR